MKLSARYEVRVNSRSNRARFTRRAAQALVAAYKGRGMDSVRIIEH